MTHPPSARLRVLDILSTALSIPTEVLDSGQSFDEIGVDSVAVVDALFALEEHLSITVDFDPAEAGVSDMSGPVSILIDRIVGMIPTQQG